ncbi:glycosyltransferase family 4 protein [Nostoc sp. FACHB-133]|uniref:glycosyltransferase family 4 protein n=1 Tax=Nostoc sp. FACHB-133 TaxID=2692835 RepID=UPI00168983B9|nr:glycosyltransferase family 4 protein [Nostoc sp. FACHB-133]MBD2526391.1 glycosyltransferase family 4 protein [Nostoc sp. FACHB-133]
MIKVALLHFGFEDYTIELANSLAKYVDLTLIHPKKLSDVCGDAFDPNIRVISFNKPRIRDPRNVLSMNAMMRIIKDIQPDVLHVQETNDPWYDWTLLLNRMPPLVTTIHDVFRHPGDKVAVFGSEYTRRIAFYRSQQLIVHTDQLKKILIEQFNLPEGRVNVIPHGELGSLYQRRGDRNNQPRDPNTLLFFGRIWPYKGLKYLLEAMPLIAERVPQVKLIIAGKGENINQYFPNGYDENRYEIINRLISLEEVGNLFQRSTLTVLPYIEASQSGVAALSYGMGTLVVASDIGGLSEIVQHKKDGLLVPPRDAQALSDAIVCLLSDRDLQQKMQTAALARCQQDLNWSNIAAQTVEVYQKTMKIIH